MMFLCGIEIHSINGHVKLTEYEKNYFILIYSPKLCLRLFILCACLRACVSQSVCLLKLSTCLRLKLPPTTTILRKFITASSSAVLKCLIYSSDHGTIIFFIDKLDSVPSLANLPN